MPNVIAAGFFYFAIVFAAGFALGVLRVLVLAPTLGETSAVLFELPIILWVSWWACGRVIAWRTVPPGLPARGGMGLFAFALLMAAEGTLSIAAGRSLMDHFALYQTLPHQLGLLGQMAFAAMPLVRRI